VSQIHRVQFFQTTSTKKGNMPRTLYVEVAVGKDELIEKIKGSKTTLRPDWEFVSTPEGVDCIVTDNPAKFYPFPKHTIVWCTHKNGMVNPGEDWGGPFAISHLQYFDD